MSYKSIDELPTFYKSLFDLPREERFVSGHRLCAGCMAGPIVRHLMKVAGKDAVVVNVTSCVEITSVVDLYTPWLNPWIHPLFENAGAVASGIAEAYKVLKRKGELPADRDIKVIALAGDGGTFDIGFQSLSGMLERGHDVLYVCYDNEAYMNTGIQRSAATPKYAWTTTTPAGKVWRGEWRVKKPLFDTAVAPGIPSATTPNPAYPLDMVNKFKRALTIKGPKLVHVLMPCTTGWRFNTNLGPTIARLAVETGVWINMEYCCGEFRVTTPVKFRKPVKEYLKLQGRFRHLTEEEIADIQRIVDEQVERVNKLVGKEVIGPVKA